MTLSSRDRDLVVVRLDEEQSPPTWLTLLDRTAPAVGHLRPTTSTSRLVAYDEVRSAYLYRFQADQHEDQHEGHS